MRKFLLVVLIAVILIAAYFLVPVIKARVQYCGKVSEAEAKESVGGCIHKERYIPLWYYLRLKSGNYAESH